MAFLEINQVSKNYAKHRALIDVSISVPQGSIYGFLGPNGAGKTSLIRIINQITAPDIGEIIFNGERLKENHISNIGYLPEERGLYKKMKIGEQLSYLAQLKGLSKAETRKRIKFWFERFDIKDWWGKKVEELSKGMQQKVQFISTVIHEPSLLILDEPFTGFDPINTNRIKDEILRLRDEGATVIFSTHRMESVEELCDHIALLNHGKKVLDGKKSDIKKAHKTNTFKLIYEGELPEMQNELGGKTSINQEGYNETILHLMDGQDGNSLLGSLMGQIKVHGYTELIPSINDIFIDTVNQSNHE